MSTKYQSVKRRPLAEADEEPAGRTKSSKGDATINFPDSVKDLENDDVYEDECGYWIIIMLRGKTTGRMLKRDIFKAGLSEIVFGFVLLVITLYEEYNFITTKYFDTNQYGATLLSLMWLVSFPSLLAGVLSFVLVKFWPTLVTNRSVLLNVTRVYLVIMFLLLASIIWCLAAVILTFRRVKFLRASGVEKAIFPCYACSLVFLFLYGIALVLYLLDVHYLAEEVEYEGEIREPTSSAKRGEKAIDLSDLNMLQLLGFVVAIPLLFLYQVWGAIWSVLSIIYENLMTLYYLYQRGAEERKRKRGVLTRLCRTAIRVIREFCASFRQKPDMVAPEPAMSVELKRLKEEQDYEDDVERGRMRERILQEAEQKKLQKEAEEAAAKKAEEEKAAKEAEEARLAIERASTMSVAIYKSLWGSLAISGSFQCKLKTAPTLSALTDHFKKQGFHVVFASSPNTIDVEVGVSNIRPGGEGKWFMARFLASANSFSAVMKSEDPDLVTGFVKKFALAKALKIDSSASGLKK